MRSFSYIPHTAGDRQKMLDFIGISDTSQLFEDIPDAVRLNRPLALAPAMSELSLDNHMKHLASQNLDTARLTGFLGAGCYEHYQPSVVDAIISRSEFYTSYTPYQPEVSQGMLQAIFEYQTMISELTGMDLANASVYDGATALAEAGIVCCAQTRRNKLLVSQSVNPDARGVLGTYARGQSIEIVEIPEQNGQIDMAAFESLMDASVAGVLVQYPNFFGCVEDLEAIADIAHDGGALLAVSTYPIALGLLKSPGEAGADIVVADGQSLGNAMAYGGPYLGIMAVKKSLMRRLPGRIVGQTTDHDGRRGFVLTLQAREQHIRREKASSNICSNQALNALAATVYLAYVGPSGLKEIAAQNYHKAHYLAKQLGSIRGISVVTPEPTFNEFVIHVPKPAEELQKALLSAGYLFGLNLEPIFPHYRDCLLVNATEVRTKAEMDGLCQKLEEIL